jgi:hypothetical protein
MAEPPGVPHDVSADVYQDFEAAIDTWRTTIEKQEQDADERREAPGRSVAPVLAPR